jgi:hypothetical protein
MGYWSAHPMSGDTPMDYQDDLLRRFNNVDGNTYYFELEEDVLRKLIEDNFEVLLNESLETENFTFPWILYNYRVNIPLESIEKVKSLIGDGGSSERDYDDDDDDCGDSPATYAKLLYDNFEKIFIEKRFDEFAESLDNVGLSATIEKVITQNSGPKLINVK